MPEMIVDEQALTGFRGQRDSFRGRVVACSDVVGDDSAERRSESVLVRARDDLDAAARWYETFGTLQEQPMPHGDDRRERVGVARALLKADGTLTGPRLEMGDTDLLVGIISGTYSTWYIASPMTIWIEEHMAQRKALEAAKPKPKKPEQQAAAAR